MTATANSNPEAIRAPGVIERNRSLSCAKALLRNSMGAGADVWFQESCVRWTLPTMKSPRHVYSVGIAHPTVLKCGCS